MKVLALDIGSSSVKAAILTGRAAPQAAARATYKTRYSDNQVDVDPRELLRAVHAAIVKLGAAARQVDLIIPTGMAPSWIALDAKGRPLTPVVTHQDRRSVEQAQRIEKSIGRKRHLRLAGNRPTPGGISSTTCAWFMQQRPGLKKKVALVGHLNTWLAHLLCGARTIDPSNASFTGLFNTTTLNGWNDDLIAAARANKGWLPEVIDGNVVAGHVSPGGARRLGLRHGTPMLAGVMDGSCPMLLAGATAGQMVHVVGSTDVLAVCTDKARPHEGLLTRGLGVGKKWLSVGTIAAAGSALDWAQKTFFADLSTDDFRKLVAKIGRRPIPSEARFDARLAGSRTDIESITGQLTHLTLGTTRDAILSSLLNSLARQSAQRLHLFDTAGVAYRHSLFTTGGGAHELARVMRRDWSGRWTTRSADEATGRGLWVLAHDAKD